MFLFSAFLFCMFYRGKEDDIQMKVILYENSFFLKKTLSFFSCKIFSREETKQIKAYF